MIKFQPCATFATLRPMLILVFQLIMRSIAWPWLQEKRCPAFELWKSSGSICGRFQHQIASKRDEVLGISILLVYFGRQREYSREKERGKRDKVAKTNANSKNTKSS